MEVASNTMQPSTSSVTLETAAIQLELDDRSFDIGDDDEIDLHEAIKSAAARRLDKKHSGDSDHGHDTNDKGTKHEVNCGSESDSDSNSHSIQETDKGMQAALSDLQNAAFTKEEADAIITELKEIGDLISPLQNFIFSQSQ